MLKPQLTRGSGVMIVNDDDWPATTGLRLKVAVSARERSLHTCHAGRWPGPVFWKLRKAVELARCALTFRGRRERSDPSRKYVGFDLRAARGCWLAGRRTDGRMCRRIDYFTGWRCTRGCCSSADHCWLNDGKRKLWFERRRFLLIELAAIGTVNNSESHLDTTRQFKSCSLN